MEWNVKDLKAVCMFEKNKEDGAIPSKKKLICEFYQKIMARKGCEVVVNTSSASAIGPEDDIKPPVVDNLPIAENDRTKTSM
jgi:hypothetical protein